MPISIEDFHKLNRASPSLTEVRTSVDKLDAALQAGVTEDEAAQIVKVLSKTLPKIEDLARTERIMDQLYWEGY